MNPQIQQPTLALRFYNYIDYFSFPQLYFLREAFTHSTETILDGKKENFHRNFSFFKTAKQATRQKAAKPGLLDKTQATEFDPKSSFLI